jgi:hypothetical protein
VLLYTHLYDDTGYRASRTNFLLSAEYRVNDNGLQRGINDARFDNSNQSTYNSAANGYQNCLMLLPDEYTNFYSDLLCNSYEYDLQQH